MKDIVNRLTNLKNYKTKINIKFIIISSIYLLICCSYLPWTIIILNTPCLGLISSKTCFSNSSRMGSVFKMKKCWRSEGPDLVNAIPHHPCELGLI